MQWNWASLGEGIFRVSGLGQCRRGSEVEQWEPDNLHPRDLFKIQKLKFSMVLIVSLAYLFRGCLHPQNRAPCTNFLWLSSQMSQEYSLSTISGEPNIKSLHIPPAIELGVQIFCVWQNAREIFSRDDLSLDFQPVLNWALERNVTILSKTWNRLNLVEVSIWTLELGKYVSHGQNPDFTEDSP